MAQSAKGYLFKQPEVVKDLGNSDSKLQSRNVRIHNRRTSIRLEAEMWSALNEIAAVEGCSIHDLCGAVADYKKPSVSFTASLRVFLMEYYRSIARKNGDLAPQGTVVQRGSAPVM